MATPFALRSNPGLLMETQERMLQALESFFPRSRGTIHNEILRAIGTQFTSSVRVAGQTGLDLISHRPAELSASLARHFQEYLLNPNPETGQADSNPITWQLLDEAVLERQLSQQKIAASLTEALRVELVPLHYRVQTLVGENHGESARLEIFSPIHVLHALSDALDELGVDKSAGTFFLYRVQGALHETLLQSLSALNNFLSDQGISYQAAVLQKSRCPPVAQSVGSEVLAHNHTMAGQPDNNWTRQPFLTAQDETSNPPSDSLLQHLNAWPASREPIPASEPAAVAWQCHRLALRQLQQDAFISGTSKFDLAVLDVVAGLFEIIMGDPEISPLYKALIAHLQIPVLKAALSSPAFFSDEDHPARQLIDIMERFSRRFPESNPAHCEALGRIEAACNEILHDFAQDDAVLARIHGALSDWLNEEDRRAEARWADAAANLEQLERQELGTLLAMESLSDLSERYPAPESILRRIEAGWVPYMASLFVEEVGEGPAWRSANRVLMQLFQSLLPPEDEVARETRLKAIPGINAGLRQGLLTQGATSDQLRDFFSAITARQECWGRPDYAGSDETASYAAPFNNASSKMADAWVRLSAAHEEITANPGQCVDDEHDVQTRHLREVDWVDFNPPYQGLASVRLAWVGVRGYMLFTDEEGGRSLSIDHDTLAAEIRAGRASAPDLSLTRKAMLRLRHQLQSPAVQ